MKWLIALISLLIAASPCQAAWRLVWDANPEPDLSGYKIHFGATSGNYSQTVDVGNVTQWFIPDEQPNGFFAATAYDGEGNESDFSNEVLFTRDLLPSPATGLVVQWVEVERPAAQPGWSLGESVIIHNPTPGIDATWSGGESIILDQRGP